jgi:hypothetical protein
MPWIKLVYVINGIESMIKKVEAQLRNHPGPVDDTVTSFSNVTRNTTSHIAVYTILIGSSGAVKRSGKREK